MATVPCMGLRSSCRSVTRPPQSSRQHRTEVSVRCHAKKTHQKKREAYRLAAPLSAFCSERGPWDRPKSSNSVAPFSAKMTPEIIYKARRVSVSRFKSWLFSPLRIEKIATRAVFSAPLFNTRIERGPFAWFRIGSRKTWLGHPECCAIFMK